MSYGGESASIGIPDAAFAPAPSIDVYRMDFTPTWPNTRTTCPHTFPLQAGQPRKDAPSICSVPGQWPPFRHALLGLGLRPAPAMGKEAAELVALSYLSILPTVLTQTMWELSGSAAVLQWQSRHLRPHAVWWAHLQVLRI